MCALTEETFGRCRGGVGDSRPSGTGAQRGRRRPARRGRAPAQPAARYGVFRLLGIRDLRSRRRGRRDRGSAGNTADKRGTGHDVGKLHRPAVDWCRGDDTVATARVVRGVVVMVEFPVPPIEVATAEAGEHQSRIDQESRASHQTPLPRVTPKPIAQICNMGSLYEKRILKKSLMVATISFCSETASRFRGGL
jgi:hypothetical protein